MGEDEVRIALRAALDAYSMTFDMAEAYAQSGGSSGPEMRTLWEAHKDYEYALKIARKLEWHPAVSVKMENPFPDEEDDSD